MEGRREISRVRNSRKIVSSSARLQAHLSSPYSFSSSCFLFFSFHSLLCHSSPSGTVTTLAGSPFSPPGCADGLGSSARFHGPCGITLDDRLGTLFVCDRDNHKIRKVTPTGPHGEERGEHRRELGSFDLLSVCCHLGLFFCLGLSFCSLLSFVCPLSRCCYYCGWWR